MATRLPELTRHFGRNRLAYQAGWVAAPFAIQQVVRLATNIVLAYMLAPEIFGLMLLVNTLRTGTELLSDIGISQSVVRSPRGDERAFLDTAWTLQVLRGTLLTMIAASAAFPISLAYDRPDLTLIILAVSPIFFLTGIHSPGLFVLQRKLQLKRRAFYDVGCTLFQCASTIALAAIIPSVWALVWGLMLSGLFATAMTYVISKGDWPRFAWHREHFREIFHFGKWIFFSTIAYFAATSTDRIYFVAVLPLALVGVYSVARTFADALGQLAQRAGAFVVFPRLAAMGDERGEAAERLRSKRFRVLALAAAATALAIAGSDQFILLIYDSRYHAAAFMLPILLMGTWFGVLNAFADAMLMGCGKPARTAQGNAVKFAVLLGLLPLAIARGSVLEALLVLILAELARWVWLTPTLMRERLASFTDDIALTGLLLLLALSVKFALGWLGVTPTPAEWWAMGSMLHG